MAYRVEEHPRFLSALQGAPDELLILLVDVVYPLLATDPTGERGGRGGSGFVRYQVLEDEGLVMLFDMTWLPG